MTLPERLKKHWPWFTAGAVALIVAIGFAVAAALGVFSHDEGPVPAPAPTPTAEVAPEPAPEPEPEPLPAPAVEIDDPHEMAFTPVWDPPDGGKYFWQVVDPDAGYPKTGGTSYVLAHACEAQTCAGDVLRTLEAGDTLTFRGQLYQIDSKTPVLKDGIGDLPVWEHVPGRLVLFTCIIETSWDQVTKNEVIVASRVD